MIPGKAFTFQVIPRVDYGAGVANTVGERAKELGIKKALVVGDPGMRKAGAMGKMVESLNAAGIKTAEFDGVEGNPKVANVEHGLVAFTNEQCDGLVAVGGGSPMDTAKAIGIVSTNGGSIRDYEGLHKVGKPLPPIIAVPTTAGTASEVSMWSVITDPDRHYKMSIASIFQAPKVALVDPLMTMSMPPAITAATGMDALTHAIEAYVSRFQEPLSDALAEAAIKLIGESLRTATVNGDDLEARDKMMQASLMAGIAFNNSGVGNAHALAMPLGGYYNVPHGVANAILLPPTMEYNLMACPQKFAKIAELMGECTAGLCLMDAARKGVEAVRKLSVDVKIPTLQQVGIKEEQIAVIAKAAFEDPARVTHLNPIEPTEQDLVGILRAAM
jgi:alcohol dehydrogenase